MREGRWQGRRNRRLGEEKRRGRKRGLGREEYSI